MKTLFFRILLVVLIPLFNLPGIINAQDSTVTVRLIDSNGNLLTGGTLQYYNLGWKDAVNNQDGTFTYDSTGSSTHLKVTYNYCYLYIYNVSTSQDPYNIQKLVHQHLRKIVKITTCQEEPPNFTGKGGGI